MKKVVSAGLIATLAVSAPYSVQASDFGRAVGAIIGGVVSGAIQREQQQRQQQHRQQQRAQPQQTRPAVSEAQRQRTRDVQQALNHFEFSAGTPDGLMGPNTRGAIRAYQRAMGFPASGELDAAERDFLIASYHRARHSGSIAPYDRILARSGPQALLLAFREEQRGARADASAATAGDAQSGPIDVSGETSSEVAGDGAPLISYDGLRAILGGDGSSAAGTGAATEGDFEAQRAAFNRDIQRDLRALDLYRGAIDGIIGPGTRRGLRAFQRQAGLREEIDNRFLALLLAAATIREDRAGSAEAAIRDAPEFIMGITEFARAQAAVEAERPIEALPLHRSALRRSRAVMGDDSVFSVNAMHFLADALEHAGEFDEAGELYAEAHAALQGMRGADDPDTLSAADSLANLRMRQGRQDDAAALFRETLDRRTRSVGENHPDVLLSRYNLARVALSAGDVAAGESELAQIHQAARDIMRPDDPLLAAMQHDLVTARLHLEQPDAAEALLRDVIDHQRDALGKQHPATLRSQAALGATLVRTGDIEAGEDLLEQTLDGHRTTLGATDPATLAVEQTISAISPEEAGEAAPGDAGAEASRALMSEIRPADDPEISVAGPEISVDGARIESAQTDATPERASEERADRAARAVQAPPEPVSDKQGAGDAPLFGPHAVIAFDDANHCIFSDGYNDFRDCLDEAGASDAGIAAARELSGGDSQTFLSDYWPTSGPVDVAEILVRAAAYKTVQGFVRKGQDFDVLGLERMEVHDAASRQLQRRYPDAVSYSPAWVINHRFLKDGGQRFTLTALITDGCRACDVIATAVGYADFRDGELVEDGTIGWAPQRGDYRTDEAEVRRRLRDGDVLEAQIRLNRLGYIAGPMDGAFGPMTQAAMEEFQRDHCLEVGADWRNTEAIEALASSGGLDAGPAPCAAGGGVTDHDASESGSAAAPGEGLTNANSGPDLFNIFAELVTDYCVGRECRYYEDRDARRCDAVCDIEGYEGAYVGHAVTIDTARSIAERATDQIRMISQQGVPYGFDEDLDPREITDATATRVYRRGCETSACDTLLFVIREEGLGQIYDIPGGDTGDATPRQGQPSQPGGEAGDESEAPVRTDHLPLREGRYATEPRYCNAQDLDDRWGRVRSDYIDNTLHGYESACRVQEVTMRGAKAEVELACSVEGYQESRTTRLEILSETAFTRERPHGAATFELCAADDRAGAGSATPAQPDITTAPRDSVYSELDPGGDCDLLYRTPEGEPGHSAVFLCSGLEGYEVLYGDLHLRMQLTYRRAGLSEAHQGSDWQRFGSPGFSGDGFAEFNHVHDTIEWRRAEIDGRMVPFATIHRWFVQLEEAGGPTERQMLVVSTVARGQSEKSCMVGSIDADANPNANELARQVADEVAPGFACGVDEAQVFGTITDQTPRPVR